MSKDPRKGLSEKVVSFKKLRILFVGNSYSFGVPNAFARTMAANGRRVKIGNSTFGGWTLAQHSKFDGTLKKLRSREWDVIVFQEHSLIPARLPKKREAEMFPPLRILVTEARNHGAVPVLYQTWGRRDGASELKNDTFFAMTARLRQGYQAAAKNAGGVTVVPVGAAWEREMMAGRGAVLFNEDGSHPTAAGDALTAETFYQTLYPTSGR